MSKHAQYYCVMRYSVIVLMILSITVIPAVAQTKGKNRLAPEVQPVLRTYPIVRVTAADAERVLSDVFKQRSITVSHNASQNSVHIWATDAEHAQMEHFLKQNQVLGVPQPSQASSGNLMALMQRRRTGGSANVSGQMRFADLQARDTGQNVPAYWQNQNVSQQNQVRQVAGYLQTPQAGLPPVAGSNQTRQIRLQRTSARDFEAKILNAIQSRQVQLTRTVSGNQTIYSIPLPNNQRMEMAIDPQSGIVTLAGPSDRVETFTQIVTLIDNESSQNGLLGVIPVTPNSEQPVRNFAQMVNRPENQFAGTQNQTQTTPQGSELRFATPQSMANGEGNELPLPPDVSGLVGPVDVEILDGYVVIRARTANDLALVQSIINYIEAMSREYEPIVMEVPMIHADCVRVTVVALQLYNEWYAEPRGRISVTPLVRPNSILLIGYQGGLQAIQDLIAKLDTPVGAEAQVQTFPLKHASSDTLATTLTTFYNTRTSNATTGGTGTQIPTGPGLASPVSISSDQRTNSIIAQAAPRDLLEIAALIMKLDKPNNDVEMELKIFPLRNTVAATLQQTLTNALTGQTTGVGGFGAAAQQTGPLQYGLSFTTIDANRGERVLNAGIFAGATVTADSSGNQLIVRAPKNCMPVIGAVIQSLDSAPLSTAQIKIFTIINGDASTIQTMLNTIFTTTAAGGVAGQTGQNYQLGDSNENSALIPVRFAVEQRTNSIVAIGSANMLAMVEAILLTLDEPEMHNRRVMIYRLLNTSAQTLATTLQTFLQNERQVRAQTVLEGELDVFSNEVIIQAEIETNSLLVSTTPNRFEQLRRMIQVLDERPAMVQIQVLIGEVDISNTNELGFELGLQDSLLFDRGILSSNDLTTIRTVTQNGTSQVQQDIIYSESRQPGINFNNTTLPLGNNSGANSKNVGSQGLSNFSLGRQNNELGYGGFVFAASSESVSVLVRALEEKRKLTVLNRPMITALHNQPSRVTVGESVQMISNVNISDVTGAQNNNVTPTDVGVTLEVTPRISLDDSVAMQIVATKSSLGPESEGTPIYAQGGITIRSPRIKQAVITTTILAQSGQVAVLGGLLSQEESHTHRAVPVVSKIPVIGQLFQYNNRYCTRKEILFLFTPQVYRSEEEADALKQLELMRMNWCSTHVAGMFNTNGTRTRVDDFSVTSSSDTIIERGSSVRLDSREIPSDEKIIENSTYQDRMLPQPNLAPAPPKPSLL